MATTKRKSVTARRVRGDVGMGGYLRRIFGLMVGAVGVTAVASAFTLFSGVGRLLISPSGGISALYYILLFGGLGLSIWAQARAFHMRPSTAIVLLMLYAIMIGVTMSPLIAYSLQVNPESILIAFGIAAAMFACMALFGYKTVKDLSFMGVFLFIGMIGLLLTGLASFIWPTIMLGTAGTVICLIGVLVFALFTAYDMNTLKHAYRAVSDDTVRDQLAVLGALHLYISFIAMFEYILSLLNRD